MSEAEKQSKATKWVLLSCGTFFVLFVGFFILVFGGVGIMTAPVVERSM